MTSVETHYDKWDKRRVKRQFSELVRLSIPIILQRLGIMTLGIVDTAMVARYSSIELAYQTISYVPVATLIVTSIGLMMGTMVLTSSAYGAKDYKNCGRIWRRSLPYGLALGTFGFVLCMIGEPVLLLLDQTPDIARGGADVMVALALGVPMTCIMLSSTFFLEGINRPLPGMVFMFIANILNILLNWVLVYGHLGFEPMGAVGSAWATSIIRSFLAISLIIYILLVLDKEKYGLLEKVSLKWSLWRKHRHIGYAAGFTNAIEHMGFAALSVFAGWLGPISLGALGIAFNVFGVPFMICYGVAGATAVRVGIARGRLDHHDMALAGICGIAFNAMICIPMMVILYFFPSEIANLFSKDQVLVIATIPLIALSVWMLFFDTAQTVMGNALRGAQDLWVPAIFYIISYSFVMIPIAYYLTFTLDHKVIGLIECIIFASVLSFTLLSSRFFYLTMHKKEELGNEN